MSQISVSVVASDEKSLTAAVQALSEKVPGMEALPANLAGVHLEDGHISVRLDTTKGPVNVRAEFEVKPDG